MKNRGRAKSGTPHEGWGVRLRTRFNRFSFNYTLLVVPVIFWTLTHVVGIFDWGKGFDRALILLAALLLTPALVQLASSNHKTNFTKRMVIFLVAVASAALVWHLQSAYQNFLNPNLIDIATTTFNAGKAMLMGKDLTASP